MTPRGLSQPPPLCGSVVLGLLAGAGPTHAKNIVKLPQVPEEEKTHLFLPRICFLKTLWTGLVRERACYLPGGAKAEVVRKGRLPHRSFLIVCAACIIRFSQILQSSLAFERTGSPQQLRLPA